MSPRSILLWATRLTACLLLSACADSECFATYDYAHRPSGYHWRQSRAPFTRDVVYYGRSPSSGRTIYVGPDNRYYAFTHRGHIQSTDMQSRWCPHNAGQAAPQRSRFASILYSVVALFAHRDRLTDYSYVRRPAGYHWAARSTGATGVIAYFGIDPVNEWTVYVGPDGQYYTFPHRGDIQPQDLTSFWDPHDTTL